MTYEYFFLIDVGTMYVGTMYYERLYYDVLAWLYRTSLLEIYYLSLNCVLCSVLHNLYSQNHNFVSHKNELYKSCHKIYDE